MTERRSFFFPTGCITHPYYWGPIPHFEEICFAELHSDQSLLFRIFDNDSKIQVVSGDGHTSQPYTKGVTHFGNLVVFSKNLETRDGRRHFITALAVKDRDFVYGVLPSFINFGRRNVMINKCRRVTNPGIVFDIRWGDLVVDLETTNILQVLQEEILEDYNPSFTGHWDSVNFLMNNALDRLGSQSSDDHKIAELWARETLRILSNIGDKYEEEYEEEPTSSDQPLTMISDASA